MVVPTCLAAITSAVFCMQMVWCTIGQGEPDACQVQGVSLLQSHLQMQGAISSGGQEHIDAMQRSISSIQNVGTRSTSSSSMGSSGDYHKVAWVHIPKCGTSFGTTLAHYANSSLPDEAQMPKGSTLGHKVKGLRPAAQFSQSYPIETWFKGLLWENNGIWGGHHKLSLDVYTHFRGHIFGMFRSPSNRMYSAWNHMGRQENPADFFEKHAATATKMLAGQQDGLHVNTSVYPDVQLALSRLDGFAFIGITDHWNLSICLFHAMLGGEVLPVEYQNSRPAEYDAYDNKVAKQFFSDEDGFDPFDSELFAKASDIFWYNVAKNRLRLSRLPGCEHFGHSDAFTNKAAWSQKTILDDCVLKQKGLLVTDPSRFWNNQSSNLARILQPVLDQPPLASKEGLKAKLAILMLSHTGRIANMRLWSAWLANARTSNDSFAMHIHTKHPQHVEQELQRFVLPQAVNTSWCDCRDAALLLIEHALIDPDVTHMALVSDNSIPIKSLHFIHSELKRAPWTRMCQDRSWGVPRAETWWSMSRLDAQFFVKHQDPISKAIGAGMIQDSYQAPCMDENAWLLPLILLNARWGFRARLLDESTMLADWHGTCKHWKHSSDACNCPNLFKSRIKATPSRPGTFQLVDAKGFSELLASPFWFARKFLDGAFVDGWDPVTVAMAAWENDSMIVTQNSCRKQDGRYNQMVLAALQDNGPGLIISGQGGSATRAAQQVIAALATHDFGELSEWTKDSLAVRSARLLHAGLFGVGVQQTGRAMYDVEDIKPSHLGDKILHKVSDSLMRMYSTMQNLTRPWALKEPWLRLLLPFYDRVIGFPNYQFVHVVHDIRNVHHSHGDEQLASFLRTAHLDQALASAMAVDSAVRSRPLGSNHTHVEKWVRFAYAWGIVELELHDRWTKERPNNYFLLTETDMAGFKQARGKAHKLAAFLGSPDPTQTMLDQMGEVYVTPSLSTAFLDHFAMMDAIIRLPGMDITRKAMKAFGYLE